MDFITSTSDCLESDDISLLRCMPLIKSSASAHAIAVASNGANGIIRMNELRSESAYLRPECIRMNVNVAIAT